MRKTRRPPPRLTIQTRARSTNHWPDEQGFRGLFAYPVERERDLVTRRVTFVEGREVFLPLYFFVETEPYKL